MASDGKFVGNALGFLWAAAYAAGRGVRQILPVSPFIKLYLYSYIFIFIYITNILLYTSGNNYIHTFVQSATKHREELKTCGFVCPIGL